MVRLTVLGRCVLDTAHGEFSLKLVDVSQINLVCGIAEGLGGMCFFGSNMSCVWFLQISGVVWDRPRILRKSSSNISCVWFLQIFRSFFSSRARFSARLAGVSQIKALRGIVAGRCADLKFCYRTLENTKEFSEIHPRSPRLRVLQNPSRFPL